MLLARDKELFLSLYGDLLEKDNIKGLKECIVLRIIDYLKG